MTAAVAAVIIVMNTVTFTPKYGTFMSIPTELYSLGFAPLRSTATLIIKSDSDNISCRYRKVMKSTYRLGVCMGLLEDYTKQLYLTNSVRITIKGDEPVFGIFRPGARTWPSMESYYLPTYTTDLEVDYDVQN
jgi:hypothetical protein